MLGIKRETLYAYASRGKVRTQQVGRTKSYLRADLERLRARKRARSGHGAVAADALRWGEPVLDTSITEIRPDGMLYRGVGALELATSRSFELVAEHLWEVSIPVDPWPLATWPLAPSKLFALVGADAHPVEGLALALPALAMRDPQRIQLRRETTLAVARRLIRLLTASLALPRGATAARHALRAPTVADSVLAAYGVRPRPVARRAVNATLVLCADHGLNPSTFAARVAASAGADLYACVAAALATLSGPRHGGMPERVAALVDEIGRPARTARVLGERLQRGEEVPGFGHTLYPDGDPRCPPLLEVARRVAPRARRTAIVEAIVATNELAGGEPPTLDLGLAAVAGALGLPRGGATSLFAIGRAAGWVSQVMEQREAGYVLRPRARYVGGSSRGL